MHKGGVPYSEGAAEGIAATEAANSAVSGLNLIPALSPGTQGACRAARRPTPHPIRRTGRHDRIGRQTEHPFIASDQQRGDCHGFRGRKVQTPHLDILASEGTSLETAITPCVACQPARASLLTGFSPRTHGVDWQRHRP